MNTKAIVAIVIVVIVVVAACAVVLVNNDDDKDDDDNFTATSRLLVYGNANNDNYLDSKDIDKVNEIISDSTIDWKTAYPYADANHDGKVDSSDVTVIQNFIDGKSGTMYYTDWNDSVSSVPYPLSGKIAALYDSTIWIAQILGVSNDITHMFRTSTWVSNLSTKMFPEASSITAFGGYPSAVSVESVLQSGVSIVLGDPWAYSDSWIKEIEDDPGTQISVVKIPENREIYGMNWANSVVTLGVMMNLQSKTAQYIDYIENVEKTISNTVENFSESEKDLSFIIIYLEPGSTGTAVDIYGTGSVQFGDISTIDDLPLTCAMKPQGTSGYVDTTVEAILDLDPDIIFFSTWGPFSNGYTEQQYKDLIKSAVEPYKTTKAYANGNIYAFAFEVYGTLPGVSGLIYLASLIWPDHFDKEEGLKLMQEYFDDFTKISGTDVRDWGTLVPLSLADINS